jgi:hypothetical protein
MIIHQTDRILEHLHAGHLQIRLRLCSSYCRDAYMQVREYACVVAMKGRELDALLIDNPP